MTKKKSYVKHVSIFLGLSVALALFVYWLVERHRDVPDQVREQRSVLLTARPASTVAERIRPFGRVDVAVAAAPAPKPDTVAGRAPARRDGQQVYQEGCIACHGSGIAGAPKLGDKGEWAKRIARGRNTLYASAIKGKQSSAGVMPPKGGNAALSDADVKAAVDFIVSQSN